MAKVSLRAYNQEIETMIDRGHLDEAIAHCRHILKTFPKHLETYRLLGKAYLEYKRYPEAADIFSRVLVATPSDFVANVGMSIIRDEENKFDDAIWHMERAFETQPSNAAIQSELQRLYGRREGVQPPRIRMTRGALAHMYVQGELYPQAISEIKSVLKDDPGRSDMQTLLARAYYRSGLKNDAAEVASAVLRSNPYNADANRVLVEILGVDRPESVQAYRQRVVELDPYAAQVTGSIFQANEVPDAAVTLEHLDWNGQPVGLQPDWQSAQAISLESTPGQEEQPDWLKNAFGSETPPSLEQPSPVFPFDAAVPPAATTEPADDIPDFLRAAGWGKSTGAFDESKSLSAESEPESGGPSIEQGELPDWVKAMAPQQTSETPREEEELPDWINKIGTSELPVPSEATDEADWMKGLEQAPVQPAAEQPDWLNQPLESQQSSASSLDEDPDWLKGFSSESATAPSASSAGDLDWLSQLSQGEGAQAEALESTSHDFDFLRQPSEPFDAAPVAPIEEGMQPEAASAASSSDDFDFLDPLGTSRASTPAQEPSKSGPPGMSEEEQDDAFAWLESLAAKQGATEGLLTKPEERLEEEPDWVKQAKGVDEYASQPPAEEAPVTEPAAGLEDLGKSEREQDDSFAWLEALAAKQGASEGLLTKPEERPEEEPEWIKQAKDLGEAPVLTPVTEPTESSDDTGIWLRSLDEEETQPQARFEEKPDWMEPPGQTPTEESVFISPASEEETTVFQSQEEAEKQLDWMKQAEAPVEEPAPQASAAEETTPMDEIEVWLRSLETDTTVSPEAQESTEEQAVSMEQEDVFAEEPADTAAVTEQPVATDDMKSLAWLDSLDEDKTVPAMQAPSADDTALWLKSLDEPQEAAPEPAQAMQPEELPAWMQDLEQEKQTEEDISAISAASEEAPEATEWMGAIVEQPEPTAQDVPKVETGGLPSWLRGLEEEEKQTSTFGSAEDLPAWLRDETGEAVAEPTRIEPTRSTDWQPVEAEAGEPEPEPAAAEGVTPEPIATEPVTQPQPEAVDVVAIIEEKIAVSEQEPEKPAPPPPPPKEPLPRKVTGALTDPVLAQARSELTRNNLPNAVENYSRLIKKGRLLEDIIYDLREALYRYPLDVDIWQSLGDAYMRSNRLQDALDAYTKAEELLR